MTPEQRLREQFTPERPGTVAETQESTLSAERPISERAGAERPLEPRVPLGALVQGDAHAPAATPSVVNRKAVEGVLEEGLEDIYRDLTPDVQQQFRKAGEETAREVTTLLQQVKLQVGKIIGLLRGWLQLIPGVNRFFLEQETKIKMDKLMRLRQPPSNH